MTSHLDKKAFNDQVKKQFASVGSRCKPPAPDATDNAELLKAADYSRVVSAAIAITALVHIREMARAKRINPSDIQLAIDSFVAAAQVEETTDLMGQILYQRKRA